jgi:hypothetical protein
MARAGFGAAKLGNDFKKIQKPGPGNNYVRVIPPMGSMAIDPLGWYAFHTTIWGFNGKHPSEPGKTIPRPIHSIEVKTKNGGITQHDPLVDWVNEHKKKTNAYKQAWMVANKEEDEKKAEAFLKENDEEYKNRLEWERRFNIESKVYINCMFKDGTFGPYKINYRDHLNGIKTKGKEVEKDGVDPFDLDTGVWFNIRRDGNGVIPPDMVEIEMEDIEVVHNGKKMKVKNLVQAPLTEAQSTQALNELPDLSTLGGTLLSYEQLVALRDCSGDPEEVDAIFDGGPDPTQGAAITVNQSGGGVVVAPLSIINSRPEVATEKPAADPAIAARLASIKAKQEAEAKEKALARDIKSSLVDDNANLTDQEFLAKFGG